MKKFNLKKNINAFILTVVGVILVAKLSIPAVFSATSTQPDISFTASKDVFTASEEGEFSLTIKNNVSNAGDISNLNVRVEFPASVNPTVIKAFVKADGLTEQVKEISLTAPSGSSLDYIHGSTTYILDKTATSKALADINNTSQLAFTKGITVSNYPKGSNSELTYKFKLKAVSGSIVVKHPDVDFAAYTANITDGQDFEDKLTSISGDSSDRIGVQLFIHNPILESSATNVLIKGTNPVGSYPKSLSYSLSADGITTKDSSVNINISGNRVLDGNVVVKDINGNVIHTLTSSEVNDLFGNGYKLNTDGVLQGCWNYMRTIEYYLKSSTTTVDDPDGELDLDKKVVLNGSEYDELTAAQKLFKKDEEVKFILKVTNTSDIDLEDVEIYDELPVYLDFESAENGHYDSSKRVITIDVGTLKKGESKEFDVITSVKSNLPQGDRSQINYALACAENADYCSEDEVVIWIDGPDITNTVVTNNEVKTTYRNETIETTRAVTQNPEVKHVKELTETGGSDFIVEYLYRSINYLFSLLGIK